MLGASSQVTYGQTLPLGILKCAAEYDSAKRPECFDKEVARYNAQASSTGVPPVTIDRQLGSYWLSGANGVSMCGKRSDPAKAGSSSLWFDQPNRSPRLCAYLAHMNRLRSRSRLA